MRLSIIAAVAENGVIGRAGKLPWHLPGDLRRFKRLTMGHTVIMGRRTWESIGRPLAGRRMVVVSRNPNYQTGEPDVAVANNLNAALHVAADAGDDEAFIIGGAELYREALPLAERFYLTLVSADVEGDAYFPQDEIAFLKAPHDWVVLESHQYDADAENEYPCTFTVWQHCEPRQRRT